jgi:hypothetical protein
MVARRARMSRRREVQEGMRAVAIAGHVPRERGCLSQASRMIRHKRVRMNCLWLADSGRVSSSSPGRWRIVLE